MLNFTSSLGYGYVLCVNHEYNEAEGLIAKTANGDIDANSQYSVPYRSVSVFMLCNQVMCPYQINHDILHTQVIGEISIN